MIETVHSKYLCLETNNCDPKNTNLIRLPARAGEGILTWTFIIGILFFRLMPHFKMVKNTLWGRRRCTRRRRCCEWDSKRSAWGYWYLNRNIVLTMFEKKFSPFQKTLFQHYNIETHLYWVKRKRVLKSWCSLDQMNMILPYYLAPDSTVNLFQTDGWRGRYEATHFFTLTPTVSGRVRRSTTNDQDMLIPGDIEKRVNNAEI